jgi:hypothetical protein
MLPTPVAATAGVALACRTLKAVVAGEELTRTTEDIRAAAGDDVDGRLSQSTAHKEGITIALTRRTAEVLLPACYRLSWCQPLRTEKTTTKDAITHFLGPAIQSHYNSHAAS